MTVSIGDRVELAPHTDEWMSGDRYGTVENIGVTRVFVRMDRSRRLLFLTPRQFTKVTS